MSAFSGLLLAACDLLIALLELLSHLNASRVLRRDSEFEWVMSEPAKQSANRDSRMMEW